MNIKYSALLSFIIILFVVILFFLEDNKIKGLSDPNKTLKEEEKKDLNSNYSYSKIDHSKPDNNLFEDDQNEASERTSFNENMNVEVAGENLDPYILEKIKKKEFFIKKITGEGRVYEIGVLDEKGSFVRLQGFEPIQLDSSYYSGFNLFVEDELSEGLAVPSDPGIYESEASEEHGKNGSIENQETGKRRDIAGSGQ